MMNETLRRSIRTMAILAAVTAAAACNQAVSPPSEASDAPPASPATSPASPIPSPSAAPSPSDLAVGSPTVTPVFVPDTFIVTISSGLRVRSKPEVSDTSAKLTPLLPLGTPLFVVSGPVAGSGFDWYLVAPMKGDLPSGWIATGRPGDPWLDDATIACPSRPAGPSELGKLVGSNALLALSCFGGHKFRFDTKLGGWEAQCGIEPCCDVLDSRACHLDGWLITPSKTFDNGSPLSFVFDGVDQSKLPEFTFDDPIRATVTGQLDHPFASGCTPDPKVAAPGAIAALDVLHCRTLFVVTGVSAR
jgi:hypothetical protein